MTLHTNTRLQTRGRRGALQVCEVLRDEILWVRIPPGSLLDERALAERFEVSRTPVREALLLLAGERLVEFLPNRTSIVSPFSLDNSGDYLDTALIISRAVARAAALSGRADAEVLEAFVRRYAQAVEADDWEASHKFELGMLRHLAGLSRNIFLIKFFSDVLDAGIRMCVLHYVPNATAEERSASVPHLESLLRAVLAGDAEESDKAIKRMLLGKFAIIARSLDPVFGDEMPVGPYPSGPAAA